MKKLLLTTYCDPREPWIEVLAQTHPRMHEYAQRHGYDFKAAWYGDITDRWMEFANPEAFLAGVQNYEARADFIRWRLDRNWLAPNWIRYAVAEQSLREGYDLVVYLDGDVVVMDPSVDVADTVPPDRWLASPINGPSPDNAGPGGPIWMFRRCVESLLFLQGNWEGQVWKTHPAWTDGVDFMAMLGYSVWPTVHKERDTVYDRAFWRLAPEWMAWHPARGRFVHIGGGNGNPLNKAQIIAQIIREGESR